MTLEGRKRLEEELKRLTHVERPAVIAAIEEARGHGDLSENADYSAAKERQGFVEGRIQDIGGKLALAEVIDPSKIKSNKIVFGATVTLNDVDQDKEVIYQIVGMDEADIKKGKVAIGSPIARAMIGKEVGDEIVVHAPKGEVNYEVLKIEYK